jgi:hypothetical protein
MVILKKRNRYIIYPDNLNKKIWDYFIGILLTTSVVCTPLDLAFPGNAEDRALY